MLFVFLASSCQKVLEDKIPPVIVLKGSNPETVLLGCQYTEAGAITTDDKPGSDYMVKGEVNSDSVGTYLLQYIAFDSDSNFAYEYRRVIVEKYNGDMFIGDFVAHDTLINVPRVITSYNVSIDKIGSNLFKMSNFNNFGNLFQVIFQPDTTVGAFDLSYSKADTIIQGQGTVSCNATGFRIAYTVETPDGFKTHKTTYEQ